MIDPLSTWLWLVDFPPGARALNASGDGELTRALAHHFATVDVLTGADLAKTRWPPATFDCITLGDARRPPLAAARLLLKPGGWLALASSEARFATFALKRAGFRDIRPYYVSPSLDHATTIIPAETRTVRAYHDFDAAQSAPALAHNVAMFVGWHELLFTASLTLARA
jgi:hypothetical protein